MVSSLITWALGFIYVVGYLLAFRRLAGQLAWHFVGQKRARYSYSRREVANPDGAMWFGAILQALVYAVVWPISLPLAYGIAQSRVGSGLLYMPPRERELIMSTRIAELEREAGIR